MKDGGGLDPIVLREVVETLGAIPRPPCSPGERQAAEWLTERLRAAGLAEVALEDEPSWGTFPPLMTGIGACGTVAAMLWGLGRRRKGLALGIMSAAAFVDEVQNGPRVARRLLRRRRSTVNVVARAGDARAERTLVVLAHHDAAQTGVLFDQSLQRSLHARFPRVLERFKTQPPQWWLGFAAPAGVLASVLTRRRWPLWAGVALNGLGTALVADMWRSETVCGANDNLSAVACLVGLAELLRERPLRGLRVLLVSCGAEETLQDGIRAFMASHGAELPRGRTWVLNYDTVGSPDRLALIEAEGPIWMEPYVGAEFHDLIARCAGELDLRFERGFRARASSDSVIPSRAGHPTAMLGSLTAWRMPANYHLPSDLPENLDYEMVADAVRLGYLVAERVADAEHG